MRAGVAIGQTRPADLTIGYIQRLPNIDFVPGSAHPESEGWPALGRLVTWRAPIRNWTQVPLTAVDFSWRLDGAVVASGLLDLDANAEVDLLLPWTWDHQRHGLELTVDTTHRFTVPGGSYNKLLVHTDALSVGFYVEASVYRLFREQQHRLQVGSSSFEDWAQRQVRLYNDLLAAAVFPETPDGVRDRLRLDAVTVVDDGALPLSPVAAPAGVDQRIFAAFRPHGGDRSVDLQFGFPREVAAEYTNFTRLAADNGFYYSGYLQHELGHARSLVDTHRLNVFHGARGQTIEIREGGVLVAGSRYMPGAPIILSGEPALRVHRAHHRGLMDSEWTFLDRYAAGAWNRLAGRRAVAGNYNSPDNLGAYVHDLPRENRLTLRDADGAILAGAAVRLYQARPSSRIFDDLPDLEFNADQRGQVLLGENPFSRDGGIDVGLLNGVAIVRVAHGGRAGYGFLEIADFNLAYWRGHTALADHELSVALQ